jgi:glycosyltransferase involved in cell wall biosynthesis
MSRALPPPTVTVVMIFRDAEMFIAEAIDSVLAQSYRDFELILVDDGSTDESTAIAKGYAARNPDVVFYTEHTGHRNLGMSASRNHGVAIGRGRLLSFLDADDIWLPNRLQRYVSAIDAFPRTGMLYGPSVYWFSWAAANGHDGAAPQQQDSVGRLELPVEQLIEPPEPLRKWLETGGSCLPGIGSLIVRREAFDAVHGFETAFRGLYEDQAFLSKIAATQAVVVISEVLDHYRQHAGSSCYRGIETGDYHPRFLNPARRRYLVWLDAYCKENGIADPAVLRALRRELRPYESRLGGLLFNAKVIVLPPMRRALQRWLPSTAWNGLRALRAKLKRTDARPQ